MWRRLRNVYVLLRVLFCDDTHAVVNMPRWARQNGLLTKCGPLCRWVENLTHRRARLRTRAEVNLRPRPFVNTDRHKDNG